MPGQAVAGQRAVFYLQQQQVLLFLQGLQAALRCFLCVVASFVAQRWWQRAAGAAQGGIATAGHVGLGNRLRLERLFGGAGIDQNKF